MIVKAHDFRDSVEGKRDATLYGVSVGSDEPDSNATPPVEVAPDSPRVVELRLEEEQLKLALARYQRSSKGLEGHLEDLTVRSVSPESPCSAMRCYITASQECDCKLTEISKRLARRSTTYNKRNEIRHLYNKKLACQSQKWITSESGGRVDVLLKYGTRRASKSICQLSEI